MSTSWLLQGQRLLLAVILAAGLVLLCALARRRLGAYEDAHRARERLVYGALANVSVGLDKIEAGLDLLAARAAAAKARLDRLNAARRQSLADWAVFREQKQPDAHRMRLEEKRAAARLSDTQPNRNI